MERGVALEVSLEQLLQENDLFRLAKESFKALKGVVFCCNVKYRFVLEVTHLKIGKHARSNFYWSTRHFDTTTFELLYHLDIIVHNSVMNWQIAVIILSIEFWLNVFYECSLTLQTNNMLNCLSLVVLLPSGLKVVVRVGKPFKNGKITIPRTYKQHIFSKVISVQNGILLLLLKKLQDAQVLLVAGREKRRPTEKVREHAQFTVDVVDRISCFYVIVEARNVQSRVAIKGLL